MTVEIACIMWSSRACGVFWDTDGHFAMVVWPFRSKVAEIPDKCNLPLHTHCRHVVVVNINIDERPSVASDL